jgi:arylsulfatase A-like enzyme
MRSSLLAGVAGIFVSAMLVACGAPPQREGGAAAGPGDAKGAAAATAAPRAAARDGRPNILLIVADDLGWSDLGAYGGEIPTPNLDALAARGLQYTNFHAAPTCSPTRTMLMTGVDHHRAGMGSMAEALNFNPQMRGRPGYEGHLNDRVVTIAQLLKDAGYATRMVGKWHIGYEPADLPSGRGFEHSFALLPGGANHFDATKAVPVDADQTLREDGRVAAWPAGRYSSDYYTDRMIGYLRDAPRDRPLFAYMAYTAPHWPLQAPDEYLRKWAGRYEGGWDAVRAGRIARLQRLGLIRDSGSVAPRPASVPTWASLTPEAKARHAREMEIYAAMVDNLDHNVGRLLAALRETGRDRDTVIVFLSDNGAESMIPQQSRLPGLKEWIASSFDNSFANLGHARSYTGYGPAWAHVSNTPQRSFKGSAYEGGTKVPAFVVVPGGRHARVDAFAHVLDLPPTLLALAGVAPPAGTYASREVLPMEGRVIVDARGRAIGGDAQRVANGELFGHRSVRRGSLKAVSPWRGAEGPGPWQLYDLARDPGEQHDLAVARPADVAALDRLHADWSAVNGVIAPSPKAPVYGDD